MIVKIFKYIKIFKIFLVLVTEIPFVLQVIPFISIPV